MVKSLAAWEMKNYASLWKKFQNKEFINKEAQSCLKIKDSHKVSVLFYNLNKKGWIEVKRDEKDKRKKVYRLKEPNLVVKEF